MSGGLPGLQKQQRQQSAGGAQKQWSQGDNGKQDGGRGKNKGQDAQKDRPVGGWLTSRVP